jgi:hypothetical protein
MSICHTVQRGDSLWGLAHRYLGICAKWPSILDYHNREAARPGRHKLLLPIKDPNLIYVSQHIMIPCNRWNVSPGTGTKQEASRVATPIDVKVTYAIGRDTPPMAYVQKGKNFTVTSQMRGEIVLELRSADRFRHNLELFMSQSPGEAKHLLQQNYNPAFFALTAKPAVEFESGKVRIHSAMAAEAGLGPYTVALLAESPLHLSGELRPTKVEGTVTTAGREYKYSTDLEFKVAVILEPKPGGRSGEPVRVIGSQVTQAEKMNSSSSSDWQKITTAVSWTIIGSDR